MLQDTQLSSRVEIAIAQSAMSPSSIQASANQDPRDLLLGRKSREENVLEQLLKDHTESIAWKSAGPAANDFRSMSQQGCTCSKDIN
jgi:hypothetical protein